MNNSMAVRYWRSDIDLPFVTETHESSDTGKKTTNVAEEKNVNRALCVSERGEIIKPCFKFFFSFGIYFRNYSLLKSNSDLWE